MVAEQQNLLVEPADVWAPPLAVGGKPPFEHGARDVERAGNDPVPVALEIGANVDQERAPFERRERFARLEAVDPRLGRLEELVERSPSRTRVHALHHQLS